MLATVQAARSAGALRADVDAANLAGRLCQSMLDLGVGMFRATRGYAQMPAITARLLLSGLAAHPPKDATLDRSPAFKAAQQAIATWTSDEGDSDDRGAALRAAARTEFGRRGYEATTIRDIAAAAGVSTGSVYRLIGSKEELLASVMQSFSATVTAGWDAVLEADATSVEKLDALMWINVNVLDRYSEEFRIQLGWVLESPPAADLGWGFKKRLRDVKTLLQRGSRSGEIQLPRGSVDVCAQSVLELVWIPETFVRLGTRPAHALARDTLLRGAAKRSRS
jgi:AcrR family transcriptional regulator